jgi:hypothetical protein
MLNKLICWIEKKSKKKSNLTILAKVATLLEMLLVSFKLLVLLYLIRGLTQSLSYLIMGLAQSQSC